MEWSSQQAQQVSTSQADDAFGTSQSEQNRALSSSALPVSYVPAPPARLMSKRMSQKQQSQLRPLPPEHGLLHPNTGATASNAASTFNQAHARLDAVQDSQTNVHRQSHYSSMHVSQDAAQPLQPDAQMCSQQGSGLHLPAIPQWTFAAVSTCTQGMARDRDFTDKQQALGEVDVGGIVLTHPSKPSRFTFWLMRVCSNHYQASNLPCCNL